MVTRIGTASLVCDIAGALVHTVILGEMLPVAWILMKQSSVGSGCGTTGGFGSTVLAGMPTFWGEISDDKELPAVALSFATTVVTFGLMRIEVVDNETGDSEGVKMLPTSGVGSLWTLSFSIDDCELLLISGSDMAFFGVVPRDSLDLLFL